MSDTNETDTNEVNMFLILVTYKKPIEIIDQFLVEHRNFLEKGYQQDQFIASGPRNPRTGGVILSQLTDREQLLKIIQQDPFYIHEVADFEVIEFNPVKFHKNFAGFVQ